jgi:agmatine/peptidylarginine deiminase
VRIASSKPFRLSIRGKYCWEKLLKALKGFNIILLPNDLHKNKITDDATGDYINIILVKDLTFVPNYGTSTDDLAINRIQTVFPQFQVVPIPSKELTMKGGGHHCASWNVLQ